MKCQIHQRLLIAHTEMMQVIQNEEGSIPMIANKPTLLRVFVKHPEGAAPQQVRGELILTNEEGLTVIRPAENQTLNTTAQPNRTSANKDESLNFVLPPSMWQGEV